MERDVDRLLSQIVLAVQLDLVVRSLFCPLFTGWENCSMRIDAQK